MKEAIRFSVEIYMGLDYCYWECLIHDLLQHRYFSYYQYKPHDEFLGPFPRKRFTRRFIIDLIDGEIGVAKTVIKESGSESSESLNLITKYAV